MKLRELDGDFVGNANAAARSWRRQDGIDGAQAVIFQCPSCAQGKPVADDGHGVQGAHYVMVAFSNPRGAPVMPGECDLRRDGTPNPRWEMSGTSLDDLTLKPSINLDTPLTEEEQRWYAAHPDVKRCTWHGFVTNGDAT